MENYTHFAGIERCYMWEGDADESTNMEEESPDLSVPY